MSEAPKKKGGIRKRTVQREDDEDEPETLSLREQIQERQHQQQQRRREQALRAEVLANGLEKLNAAQADGLSQRETNDLLDSYVREQVEEKGAGESHMEAFIKEQMQKRLGKDAEEAAASSTQLHPDDELYAVPSDLQGQSTKAQDPGAWATGIVEVALPVEYKMRNIEETEAAKRRLLHASRGTQDEMQSPTSGPALRRGIYPSGFGKLTALTAPPQTSDSYVADKMRDELKAKRKKKRHV